MMKLKKPKLFVCKIFKDAIIPTKATKGSVCYDIYSAKEHIIQSHHIVALNTGIIINIPKGYEGVIRQRSSIALKYGNYIANGVGTIDSDYRNHLFVLISNNTDYNMKIEKHQRIAQLGIRKVPKIKIKEINRKEQLKIRKKNDRGGGLGSTGK